MRGHWRPGSRGHVKVDVADLESAKKLLEDAEELKRQRSNLAYYLKGTGLLPDFTRKSVQAKKEFLASWFAARVAEKRGKLDAKVELVRCRDWCQQGTCEGLLHTCMET